MKRSELLMDIWRQSEGVLQPAARVAVIGGGISGLHLAQALAGQNFSVTVFEPRRTGGVRIPLMHACHTLKTRAPLWEKSATYARLWYRDMGGDAVTERNNAFGSYFIIEARRYLKQLKRRLKAQGVQFSNDTLHNTGAVLPDFALTCVATGAATALAATQIIPGWESYFSRHGAPAPDAEIGKNGDKVTNYMHLPSRAGFIHRNGETRDSAAAFARGLHPTGRHALLGGQRLTTRDRFPVVGFAEKVNASPFLFCAMGYHAMTYAPYLAHAVAAHLTGDGTDENLISTLSPARFLPRNKDG